MFVDPLGLDVEVVFWAPVGYGRSSLGHVSVRINSTSYSFSQGGMDIRPFDDYRDMNSFRDGHGHVVEMERYAESAVERLLSGFNKEYNYAPNNCTTPIQDALRQTHGFGVSPMGEVAPQSLTPSQMESMILSNFNVITTNLYPRSP